MQASSSPSSTRHGNLRSHQMHSFKIMSFFGKSSAPINLILFFLIFIVALHDVDHHAENQMYRAAPSPSRSYVSTHDRQGILLQSRGMDPGQNVDKNEEYELSTYSTNDQDSVSTKPYCNQVNEEDGETKTILGPSSRRRKKTSLNIDKEHDENENSPLLEWDNDSDKVRGSNISNTSQNLSNLIGDDVFEVKGNSAGKPPHDVSVPETPLHKKLKVQPLVSVDRCQAEKKLQGVLANDTAEFRKYLFTCVARGELQSLKLMVRIMEEGSLQTNVFIQKEFLDANTEMSVLHLALAENRIPIVKYLIRKGGDSLVLHTFKSMKSTNHTVLHIAIPNCDVCLIEDLLLAVPSKSERANLINTHANGGVSNEVKLLNGSSALALAVWSGKPELIELLTRNGADLLKADSIGNTFLHTVILQSVQGTDKEMYYKRVLTLIVEASAIWTARKNEREKTTAFDSVVGMQELLRLVNAENLTPLQLAAKKESCLFGSLINLKDILSTRDISLGNFTSTVYDILEITSYSFNTYSKSSCLHLVAHNPIDWDCQERKVDLLESEPMHSVIKAKWTVYRYPFWVWFFVHLIYMSLLTYFALDTEQNPRMVNKSSFSVNRHSTDQNQSMFTNWTKYENDRSSPEYLNKSTNIPKSAGFLERHHQSSPLYGLFLILPILYLLLEIIDLVGNKPYTFSRAMGWRNKLKMALTRADGWSLTANRVYRGICFVFSLSVIIWFILYQIGNRNQDIAIAMAMIFGWSFSVFFSRVIKKVGVFSIMIQRMIFTDLIPFLGISMFLLLSFSFAMHAMLVNSKEQDESHIHMTIYSMFQVMVDLDSSMSYEKAREHIFGKILMSSYAIMLVILLINMLIAAMNTSYEVIRTTKTNLVLRQRLSILLMIERRSPKFLCRWSEQTFQKRLVGHAKCYIRVTEEK